MVSSYNTKTTMDSNNNPLSTLAALAASSQSASIDDNSSWHGAPNAQTSTSPGTGAGGSHHLGNANVQTSLPAVGGQQLERGQSQQTTAPSASLIQLLLAQQQQQQQQIQLQNLLAQQQPVANQSGNLQAFNPMQPPPVAAPGLSLTATDPTSNGNPLQALIIQQLAQQQRTAQLQALQGLALNAVGQIQSEYM